MADERPGGFRLRRRELILGMTTMLLGLSRGVARTISGHLPWVPNAGSPPEAAQPGPWLFLTAAEVATLAAIADRIIPPDPETPGGNDAGCVVFIDRQLAGPYGHQEGLYVSGPFQSGAKNQGPQSRDGPAQQYRSGLAALERACQSAHAGRAFSALAAPDQDAFLKGLEAGEITLPDTDGKAFFAQLIKDVQMGFFADPLYGGNRDMVAWKMIGYPGARYNYLDWVNRHNERYPLPPVGLTGRAEWTPRR